MGSSLFFFTSSLNLLPPPLPRPSFRQSLPPFPSRLQLQQQPHLIRNRFSYQFQPPSLSFSSIRRSSSLSNEEGTIPVMELVEKDWSFLDIDNLNSTQEQNNQKFNRIISAGEIDENSRVLVSISSEDFVDRLVEYSSTKLLLIVHDSLFVLAGIKEKYDNVKCWQGEIIYVPEKWFPFDVVFLYFLPALPFQLDQVFGALAQRCSPGARVIISHPQGKTGLEQQRKEHPDVVISYLPDKLTLEKVAADHSLDITEFVDEPDFYLAVLKFNGK